MPISITIVKTPNDLGKKMNFLIDTNILIYRLKNLGNVNANFLKYKDNKMLISVISYGELVYGANKSKSVEKNMATVREIKSIFPMLDITPNVMDIFGEIKADTQKIGKSVYDMDLLIAASAIAHNMTLVTHNTKHFENISKLQVMDWF
ncbi:MAG: PIN domain-containing protein [Neisseriaceae bacterium]|nr:PIN domain-containing protein [Neisseriaceae bacterium]